MVHTGVHQSASRADATARVVHRWPASWLPELVAGVRFGVLAVSSWWPASASASWPFELVAGVPSAGRRGVELVARSWWLGVRFGVLAVRAGGRRPSAAWPFELVPSAAWPFELVAGRSLGGRRGVELVARAGGRPALSSWWPRAFP